jgi:DNA-binding LytR/AlgR family response regulator
MVNILILSDNLHQTRQLTGSLLRFAPDLKIRLARTLAEAEKCCEDLGMRVAFVDRRLAKGCVVDLAEKLRRMQVNRFLPIVILGSDEDAGVPGGSDGAGGLGEVDGPDGAGGPGSVLPEAVRRTSELAQSSQSSPETNLVSMGMVFFPSPIAPEDLKRLLEQVFVEWRVRDHRASPRIFLDQAGAARWVSEDEIVLVEYASRRVVIHLRKEVIEYKYMPLQKFAAQLSSQFVQVHQSYVVNFAAVKSYNRQQSVLKMAGSPVAVPVGRSYQKSVADLIRGLDE